MSNHENLVTTRTVYYWFGIPVWVRTRKVAYKSVQHLTGAALDAQVAWINAR